MYDQYPILWEPPLSLSAQSELAKFTIWLEERYDLSFDGYEALWAWSVDKLETFWEAVSIYFDVIWHHKYSDILIDQGMPDVKWFVQGQLNYAEHIIRKKTDTQPILHFKNEWNEYSLSWEAFEKEVIKVQLWLKEKGVTKDDRVAAYLPHIPEALIGFVAASSLGIIWSSCSPDFGEETVVQRFAQIEPKVLITVDGYQYNGKQYDRKSTIHSIRSRIASIQDTLFINYIDHDAALEDVDLYRDLVTGTVDTIEVVPVAFDHPLWVVYSSGTTGAPKAITHSHGGALLEHLKYMPFHNDVKQGETYFWYTTTGWIMWNISISSLLAGAVYAMYDGSPAYPSIDVLWQWVDQLPIHHFGVSPGYLLACKKAGIELSAIGAFDQLRSISSTGAPLTADLYAWVYEQKKDVWLISMSGGTDVATAFIGGNPLKEVRTSLIQCRALGVSLFAFDHQGNRVVGELGEMVITKPMPSMPIYFWNDEGDRRYVRSYFEHFPKIWRHGDWIIVFEDGALTLQGRSDSTLNRKGIRIGTAEIYNVVDQLAEIKDSLVLNFESGDRDLMPLFVVVDDDVVLDEDLVLRINRAIRTKCSPRHVPDSIHVISEVPYTLSGKKMEVPLKKLFMGHTVDASLNKDAMRNPSSINQFTKMVEDGIFK